MNYNQGYIFILINKFYFLNYLKRSRRGFRRLFGIRENKFFNKDLFDINEFTIKFLNQYNKKVLRRGQHVIHLFLRILF